MMVFNPNSGLIESFAPSALAIKPRPRTITIKNIKLNNWKNQYSLLLALPLKSAYCFKHFRNHFIITIYNYLRKIQNRGGDNLVKNMAYLVLYLSKYLTYFGNK